MVRSHFTIYAGASPATPRAHAALQACLMAVSTQLLLSMVHAHRRGARTAQDLVGCLTRAVVERSPGVIFFSRLPEFSSRYMSCKSRGKRRRRTDEQRSSWAWRVRTCVRATLRLQGCQTSPGSGRRIATSSSRCSSPSNLIQLATAAAAAGLAQGFAAAAAEASLGG